MENSAPQQDPEFEAARRQLEAEAYDPVEQDPKQRGPGLVYSTNDVVQDAARELQTAFDALIVFRVEHGTQNDQTGGRPTLEALRQIARLQRVCENAVDQIGRALILSHVAAPALAHYLDLPTYSLNEWAESIWQGEGRSTYERDDE